MLAQLRAAIAGLVLALREGVNAHLANPHGARLEQRFAVNIPARLYWNRRVYESYTHDVSRRGLRLLTQGDPTVQFLVKLDLELPGAPEHPLTLHAMVVHVARDERDLHNRIGMRLYGIGDEDRRRWGQFIEGLARPPEPPPSRSQPIRRLKIADPTSAGGRRPG